MAKGVVSLDLIDDYFPDYQFGCCRIVLLNDPVAKKAV